MGAHKSKIDTTDWDAADGGVTSAETSISKAEPTDKLTTLTCLPMKQLHIGTKYELTVLASEEASIDSPLYEVVDLDMFKHGFHITDSDGKVILRANGGDVFRYFLYTKEPNYEGQIPEPGLDMYKRGVVQYDSQHRQLLVSGIRPATDEESVYKAYRGGLPDKPVLVAEVVRAHTITLQTYTPSNPDSLVGYWKWSKPISIPLVKDKIELQVAKNTDVILHIALVAIARGIRAAEWKGNAGDAKAVGDFA